MLKKVISLFFICCLSETFAMKIVPFVHSFAPVKGESTIQYFLTNNSSEKMAFEVLIFKRKQNIKGEDVLEKDDESFVVFPSQVIIPGNSSRSIKVKWVGNKEFEKNPQKEQAFRVSFEQFHIDFKNKRQKIKGASLEIKLRMLASLYMTPKGAAPNLKIVSVTKKTNEIYVIRVKNEGNSRISTNAMTNTVVVFGKERQFKDVISKNDINSVVMPQSESEFIVTTQTINHNIKK